MRYVSKKKELVIVVRPIDRIIDEHRRVQVIPGKKVTFFNFMYETQDPEIIEALHSHPLRKLAFDEVVNKDMEALKRAKELAAIPMAQGVQTSSTVSETTRPETVEVVAAEPAVRPTDTAAISPELARVIDEKIQMALSTIVELLEKQDKKEKQVMGKEKIKKIYKCPYCGDTNFDSPFKLGTHKKECPEKK